MSNKVQCKDCYNYVYTTMAPNVRIGYGCGNDRYKWKDVNEFRYCMGYEDITKKCGTRYGVGLCIDCIRAEINANGLFCNIHGVLPPAGSVVRSKNRLHRCIRYHKRRIPLKEYVKEVNQIGKNRYCPHCGAYQETNDTKPCPDCGSKKNGRSLPRPKIGLKFYKAGFFTLATILVAVVSFCTWLACIEMGIPMRYDWVFQWSMGVIFLAFCLTLGVSNIEP